MKLDLTENAVRVLEARYLNRNEDGKLTESPEDLFRRVARHVAAGEAAWAGEQAAEMWEAEFLSVLTNLEFLPNSPTLMNAGMPQGQLSACFVLPVEDSMEKIFDSLKLMALIQQSGGGTGFSFSRLRPRGDRVRTAGGAASGPVSFMKIFDCATDHIKQGGRRRGANMGVLRVDHPDIREFITAKLDGASFRNFNLSVGVTDALMQAAASDGSLDLLHPATGRKADTVSAGELFHSIAEAAWESGDPGLVFLNAINRANPTPALGAIEATNPCGEVPLLPYEACNLGSVNLSRMVRASAGGNEYEIDWEKLKRVTHIGVRFLDDVIDAGRWPDPRIESMVRGNRKVGLGVMGFAELLILLGVPYASTRAVEVAGEVMHCMAEEARDTSRELASERGVFPHWQKSVHAERNDRRRNATVLSIAPTGTISIIAGTSSGIEPLFALAYHRSHVLGGEELAEVNPLFLRYAQRDGFHSDRLLEDLRSHGNLEACEGVPPESAELFRTALEIPPHAHLDVQAAFQRHVDNAVSKTINLPHDATVDDVASIYRRAWEAGLKGITVYRYGSKLEQVLELGAGELPSDREHFSRCDPLAC